MNAKLFTKVVHVPSVSREQWLEIRKTGVGGSDAGAIAGLSKYSSPLSVYCEKLGLVPEREDAEVMRQGRDLEEYVARRFCEAEEKAVKRFNYLVRSIEYPWAIADIDRLIIGENALLECKTTSLLNPTDFEGGNIPPYWYCQAQHYLAVTGCDVCYLAVMVLSKAFYCFRVERSEEDIRALMEMEKSFWEENVQKRKLPVPSGSDRDDEIIGELFPDSLSEESCDLALYEKELQEYKRLKEEIGEREERADEIEQVIKLFLKDVARGETEGVKISWKTQTRRTLDSRRLKAELPEVYTKYSKESVTRPFRINFSEE